MTASSGIRVPGPLALSVLSKNWGFIVVRGLAAIAFGAMALAWPGPTLLVVTWMLAAYMLADGVVSLIAAFAGGFKDWIGGGTWWLAFVGVWGVIAGLCTFFYPNVTDLILVTFFAIWMLLRGVTEIVAAIHVRKHIQNESMLILHGAISALVGIALLVSPIGGALAIIRVLGVYAILIGALLIAAAMSLKKHGAAVA